MKRSPLFHAALAACAGLAGCEDAAPETGAFDETPSFRVAAHQDSFGFESPYAWTASAGTISAASQHVEGQQALGLQGFGYTELTSPPMSTLVNASDELGLSIRLPQAVSWGQVQLFVSIPSLGLQNGWVDQAFLAGLPAGQFTDLTFDIPAHLMTYLTQDYSDLRFRIVINGPSTSAPYVFDNLHFRSVNTRPSCGVGVPYNLVVTGAEDFDPARLQTMLCAFYDLYPGFIGRFGSGPPTTVGMHLWEGDSYGFGWMWAGHTYYDEPGVSTASTETLIDLVAHEVAHVLQVPYLGYAPPGFIEGMATFVEQEFTNPPMEAQPYAYGMHYLNGYDHAANFYRWIDENYRVGQTPIVDSLHVQLLASTYTSQSWVDLTGHTMEELWEIFSGGAVVEAPVGVRVYEHSYNGGYGFTLGEGEYDLIDLQARAIGNDRISSIAVAPGYSVTVYEHAGFTGASATYDAETPYLDAFDDEISSLVVELD